MKYMKPDGNHDQDQRANAGVFAGEYKAHRNNILMTGEIEELNQIIILIDDCILSTYSDDEYAFLIQAEELIALLSIEYEKRGINKVPAEDHKELMRIVRRICATHGNLLASAGKDAISKYASHNTKGTIGLDRNVKKKSLQFRG